MKLTIASIATHHIHCFARYTTALNADYALRHGYSYHVCASPSTARHPSWGKVEMARELLPRCDWLFVIDADAIFLQVDKSLESFTKLPGDLLLCENGPNGGRPLNCGVMLMRNTPEMQRFLDAWYAQGAKYAWQPTWEQEFLNDYCQEVPAESRIAPITALPFDAFNSHWRDFEHPTFYNRFVLHVMGNIGLQAKQLIFQQLHARRFGLAGSAPAQPAKPVPPQGFNPAQIIVQ